MYAHSNAQPPQDAYVIYIIANIDKKSTVVNHKDLNLMVHMTDFLMALFYKWKIRTSCS